MELTEALKILKAFRDCMVDQHGCPISDAPIAIDIVLEELSNANRIRHGRWIEEPGMFMCSVCYDPWSAEDEAMIKEFNYCPNCGAKMEEQEWMTL